jgi:hypothetical protein
MRSVTTLSIIAMIAALTAAPANAADGLLGGGGVLGTGIGTPGGALGTGLLSSDTSGGGASGDSTGEGALGGGGVLGTGIGTPGGALGTGLLAGSGNLASVDALGAEGNVLVDLFGADPNVRVGLNEGALGDGLVIDLFGGGNGNGGNGGNNGAGSNGGALRSGLRVASLDSVGDRLCFAPSATQIAKLVNRHRYVNATFASWGGARNVNIVDVNLCSAAQAKIASQNNIGRLQQYLSMQASLVDRLESAGHVSADVIGADKSGTTLVLYVM